MTLVSVHKNHKYSHLFKLVDVYENRQGIINQYNVVQFGNPYNSYTFTFSLVSDELAQLYTLEIEEADVMMWSVASAGNPEDTPCDPETSFEFQAWGRLESGKIIKVTNFTFDDFEHLVINYDENVKIKVHAVEVKCFHPDSEIEISGSCELDHFDMIKKRMKINEYNYLGFMHLDPKGLRRLSFHEIPAAKYITIAHYDRCYKFYDTAVEIELLTVKTTEDDKLECDTLVNYRGERIRVDNVQFVSYDGH